AVLGDEGAHAAEGRVGRRRLLAQGAAEDDRAEGGADVLGVVHVHAPTLDRGCDSRVRTARGRRRGPRDGGTRNRAGVREGERRPPAVETAPRGSRTAGVAPSPGHMAPQLPPIRGAEAYPARAVR